jgi:hypothetical protein
MNKSPDSLSQKKPDPLERTRLIFFTPVFRIKNLYNIYALLPFFRVVNTFEAENEEVAPVQFPAT